MRTRPKKSARVRVRAQASEATVGRLEETGLVTHTPRGAHLELVVGRVGQPRGGGRRGGRRVSPFVLRQHEAASFLSPEDGVSCAVAAGDLR